MSIPADNSEVTDAGRLRLHRRVTINAVSNVAQYGFSLIVAFFMTPLIVRTVGDSSYGLWVVLLSFIGYAGMLEIGIQPAVVKLVGQIHAEGKREDLLQLIASAVVFFMVVGTLVAAFFVWGLPHLIGRFTKDPDISTPGLLFVILAADVIIYFMELVFSSILYGLQMFHIKNMISIAAGVLNVVLLLALLENHGLVALAGCKALSDAFSLVVTLIVCGRILPIRGRQILRGTRRSFAMLLGFGSRVFVSATAARMANYAQPIIIGAAMSSAATVFYSIPARLVDYSRQISWSLATGFMPTFSELQSLNKHSLMRAIYLRYSRYILLATIPIILLIIVYGRGFISVWMGPEYADRGAVVLNLLAVSALLESFQPLMWRLFLGTGRLGLPVKLSACASGLTIVLGILLVKPLGIGGVALAVLAATAISQVVLTLHVCRYLELPVLDMIAAIHRGPFLAGALAYIMSLLIVPRVGTASYGAILTGSALLVILFIVAAYRLGLESGERTWIRGRLVGWVQSIRR